MNRSLRLPRQCRGSRPRVGLVRPGPRQAGPVAENREPATTVRLGRRAPWVWWFFTQVTVLPVLLGLAWLVPGAALLMAGRLRPAPMLLISVPLAVVLIAAVLRRVPGQRLVPAPGAGEPAPAPSGRGPAGGAWPARSPWRPDSAHGRSGSTHRRSSRAPARRGVPARLLDRRSRLTAYPRVAAGVRRRASRARLRQHRPGRHARRPDPAVHARTGHREAGGWWIHGMPTAVLVSPVLGALAVLTFGGLAGRLVGPQWAPPAALVLGRDAARAVHEPVGVHRAPGATAACSAACAWWPTP